MRALCPHCGHPNAPIGDGRIERHYRLDHRHGVDPGNQLCMASFTRPRAGEPCNHPTPTAHCAEAIQ
jgi:hypothetical protein